MVNVPGHWKKSVVYSSCTGVVSCLASLNHLKERLGCDVAVSDKHTIDIEAGVEEVLVVTCEDSKVGVRALDDGNLNVPSAHVTNTVLHGNNTRLGSNIEKCLQAVGGFGVVGILEEDERKTRLLVHCLVPVLGCWK
jgi:hypothetical protein